MGRKSSLTPEQWLEVERRHVVDGESINSLAFELGVNESSIRRKIKPNKAESPNRQNKLQVIAQEKVRIDAESKRIAEQIAELPYAKQQIVSDLARKLNSISEHIGSAAEYSAASAHRLALMANQQLERVDTVDPLKSMVELQAAALLQKMSNVAAAMPAGLIQGNRAPPDAPKSQEQVDDELMHLMGRACSGVE